MLQENCERLARDVREFVAILEFTPSNLPDFCKFVEEMKEHLSEQGAHWLEIGARQESVQILYNFLRY